MSAEHSDLAEIVQDEMPADAWPGSLTVATVADFKESNHD